MTERTSPGKKVKTGTNKLKLYKQYLPLYLMFVPVVAYYILFHYKPLLGVIIAFKNYNFKGGIWGSPWAGLAHFQRFLGNGEFWRVFKNTVVLAMLRIAVTFPAPIILALCLNEIKSARYKKVLQTVSYLPHFISWVIVYAIFYVFLSNDGVINQVLANFGVKGTLWLGSKQYYRPIFVTMALWKEIGWGAIIYLASLSQVSAELYEAADIDGATKLQKIWHITLPAIRAIISIQFVRTMGGILQVSFDQTLVMNNVMVSEVADVLSYYVYQIGILSKNQFSYATAMGLFDSALTLIIVIITNRVAKTIDEDGGLW